VSDRYTPATRSVVSRTGSLPPGLVDDAAEVLADAFADDPWARYVTGRPHRRSVALLMRVPVVAAACRGALLTAHHPDGAVLGAATWVPADQRGGGLLDALRARAAHLPLLLGPAAMCRLVQEETDTDRWVDGLTRAADAYLWVLGVRRGHHGAGWGRALVEATAAAASAGHERLLLVTHNPGNVARYERMGFHLLAASTRPSGLRVHAMARSLRGAAPATRLPDPLLSADTDAVRRMPLTG
jgi:GNAT superfamily N-acetyltransferase